jgi:hypothetical protein
MPWPNEILRTSGGSTGHYPSPISGPRCEIYYRSHFAQTREIDPFTVEKEERQLVFHNKEKP